MYCFGLQGFFNVFLRLEMREQAQCIALAGSGLYMRLVILLCVGVIGLVQVLCWWLVLSLGKN
jgi:hypothetical protein